MKKLLALDQSSAITGWSIFINGELTDYGLIKLPKEDELGFRLSLLRSKVKELITKYEITEVAFEDIQLQASMGNNVKTFKVLAMVYGIILELLTELALPYTVVPSSTWKSSLGIKGKSRPEQKRDAQRYVFETYNITPTQDEVDAICIGSHIIDK